jgi:hypothetical protein
MHCECCHPALVCSHAELQLKWIREGERGREREREREIERERERGGGRETLVVLLPLSSIVQHYAPQQNVRAGQRLDRSQWHAEGGVNAAGEAERQRQWRRCGV